MSQSAFELYASGNSSGGFKGYRRLFAHYLQAQWLRILLLTILILTSIGLQLVNPQIIRYYLDTAQSGGPLRALILAACVFISFALIQQVVDLVATYINLVVSWSAVNRLRSDLALHCLKLDMSFHKRFAPGEIIERVDGDINQLGSFFAGLPITVLGNGLLIFGILVMLFRVSPALGAGMLLYTFATLIVLSLIQSPATSRWTAERQASAEQFGFIEEHISGAEEIRAIGAEPYVIRNLLVLMRSYLEKARAARVLSSLTYNLTNLIYVLGYAIGLGLGVYLYTHDQATLGTAYLIVYYVGMLAGPLQAIREQAQGLQQASASVQRVSDLFSQQPHVRDPGDDVFIPALPSGPLSVEFQRVSFQYEAAGHALKEISFCLGPGKVLGILGRTGSGKSTLSRLLFRLYDPTQGAIQLGGIDIRSTRLADLRERVGMVTQDVQLFDATVRNNLTLFNPEISDEQIKDVLQRLRLWEWVQSLPAGLDTRLAAGNQGISAGEAQLLAFARVFLRNPGLVILDEASSRLDLVTENLMEGAVGELFAGRTGVVIAHRLKTVQRADEILILENGNLVEYGARQRLAADSSSRYYRLLQTGLEEVLA